MVADSAQRGVCRHTSYTLGDKMIRITKEAFYRHATSKGLALLMAKGLPLEETKILLGKHLNDNFAIQRTICTRKGNRLYRGESSLTLDKNDTIYQYGQFFIVHTFTSKDNRCSFDSYNTIIYI